MALVVNDRVKETSTTTGTGTLTLAGAVTGFETFSSAIGNANTTYYAIVNTVNSEFEVGLGTVSAAALARTTVISSSNSDSAVNFSAGTKNVFVTLPASKSVILDSSGNIVANNGSNLTNLNATNLASGTVNNARLPNPISDKVINASTPLTVKGDGSSADGQLILNCSQNSHGVKIKSPAHAANATWEWILPVDDGTSGQVLTTDGNASAQLSWTTPEVGDITAVTAGTNLTGGGSSGDVTLNLADASTSAKGAASFSSDNFAASSGAITIKDLGVATAEIQDDAITLGKMAPGTDGNIISYDTSGNPVAVATGSSGQVLTSAGAGAVPSFQTPTVGDITAVTAGTGMTGGGASGDVTLNVIGGTGITANADDIAIDSTVATLTGSQTLTNKSIVATQLTGTIADARFPATLPALNGSALTALNASNLASGTVANARLDAQLQDVAGLAVTNGNFIVGNGSNFVAESGSTARDSLGLGTASNVEFEDTRVDSFGVGTAASGTTGEIRATNDVTAFYSSDRSLKENIKNIEHPLEKISQINGVTFDWTEDYIKEHGGEDKYFVRKNDVGVIAQEIEKVLPQVVATRENGIKAVKYDRIVALLIESVKELKKEIEELKSGA